MNTNTADLTAYNENAVPFYDQNVYPYHIKCPHTVWEQFGFADNYKRVDCHRNKNYTRIIFLKEEKKQAVALYNLLRRCSSLVYRNFFTD